MPPTAEAPREEAKGAAEAGDAAEAVAAAPKSSGGFKAWLPLIITIVTMPALAFVMTRFVLLPKMVRALGVASANSAAASEAASTPASTTAATGEPGKLVTTKVMVPMNKLLVNVAGTMGTRYLMTSVTLVGNTPEFKDQIENNKDQLMDLATGALCSKTIADLEKPGARNVIRSELMTVLNNALGGPVIQEIYITELAIQ